MNQPSFDEWFQQVEALCIAHLACTWDDLCGEPEPLESAFLAGDDPIVFVHWWTEKYDLAWFELPPFDVVNFGTSY